MKQKKPSIDSAFLLKQIENQFNLMPTFFFPPEPEPLELPFEGFEPLWLGDVIV